MLHNIYKKIKHHFYDYDWEMPNLIVISGQKCTLHCKNCSNFSPYHSSRLDFYNADDIIQDLENIIKRIKCLIHIQLQGGDFFLHPNAYKILNYIANEDKIMNCTIATNCILLPKQELLDIIKQQKFSIRISNYGTANEKNKDKLEKLLIENKINYRFHHYANQDNTWSYCGGVRTPKQTKISTIENYEKCGFKVCLTLENGIISRCSRATVAHLVQKFTPAPKDFVYVRNKLFSVHDLKKFWNYRKSSKGIVTACYYCYGTSGGKILPGEQLTRSEYIEIRKKVNV